PRLGPRAAPPGDLDDLLRAPAPPAHPAAAAPCEARTRVRVPYGRGRPLCSQLLALRGPLPRGRSAPRDRLLDRHFAVPRSLGLLTALHVGYGNPLPD